MRPRYQPRWEPKPALPLALALTMLWVGLVRLLWMPGVASFPPCPEFPPSGTALTAFWEFWFVRQGGLAPVQRSLMAVNTLWALWLWAKLRAFPRGTFGSRSFQLAIFGGAAAVLAFLQLALADLSSFPDCGYFLIELDPSTSRVFLP